MSLFYQNEFLPYLTLPRKAPSNSILEDEYKSNTDEDEDESEDACDDAACIRDELDKNDKRYSVDTQDGTDDWSSPKSVLEKMQGAEPQKSEKSSSRKRKRLYL